MLTASAIKTYQECPRKYEWSYVEKIRRVRDADALRFGSLYHGVQERLDLGVEWDNIVRWVSNIAATQMEMQQVCRLVAEHRRYYPAAEVVETEGVWQLDIGGVECTGKRDRIVSIDGERVLQEYKTSGEDISPGSMYWQRLRMDTQTTMYALSADVTAVLYDVVRKPTIRQKKTETPGQYGERLTADIRDRPEYYFQRQRIELSEQQMLDTVEDIRHIDRLLSLEVYPRNTAACTRFGKCEYFSECMTGRRPADGVPVGFRRLTTAHPELTT